MRVENTIILYLSKPVGKDKYALVHFLKESSYSLFYAFMVNSVHDFIYFSFNLSICSWV